jgi:nitroimidazol reductase NimA-like FMN-containing flavoprotein (pyridoxamine 5'-phosphate oxidase superfamily)
MTSLLIKSAKTSKSDRLKILKNNYIAHLSYIYRGKPYIVPISYYYDKEKNVILGYSSEGHKIRSMRRNSNVSLNVSEIDAVGSWVSVLAQGVFFELSGSNAKTQLRQFSDGIKTVVAKKEQRGLKFINEFSGKVNDDNVAIVFEITIDKLSGKTGTFTLN